MEIKFEGDLPNMVMIPYSRLVELAVQEVKLRLVLSSLKLNKISRSQIFRLIEGKNLKDLYLASDETIKDYVIKELSKMNGGEK